MFDIYLKPPSTSSETKPLPQPGTAGHDPASNGHAPGALRRTGLFAPTASAYGYQDQMTVRNSAGC
jgi:hypothetical protein